MLPIGIINFKGDSIIVKHKNFCLHLPHPYHARSSGAGVICSCKQSSMELNSGFQQEQYTLLTTESS